MLVYMAPLAGLFVMASIFQVLFASDIASLCGALLGGVGGFLVARGLSPRLAARQSWQPVILNVALPPDLLRVDTLFLRHGPVISLALIFIYLSCYNATISAGMLDLTAFPGFADVV